MVPLTAGTQPINAQRRPEAPHTAYTAPNKLAEKPRSPTHGRQGLLSEPYWGWGPQTKLEVIQRSPEEGKGSLSGSHGIQPQQPSGLCGREGRRTERPGQHWEGQNFCARQSWARAGHSPITNSGKGPCSGGTRL